jgi:hypothetical protein
MMTISRQEARERAAEARVARMTASERAKTLDEWWTLDSEDDGWSELPVTLRNELQAQDEAPSEPTSSMYDPLLRLAAMRETYGVRNAWLQAKLEDTVEVVGEPEKMLDCRCCGYLTIRERGQYGICPVCFWEDDGLQDTDRVSGSNHMTLREAKENFSHMGACSKNVLQHIAHGVREMFSRADEED